VYSWSGAEIRLISLLDLNVERDFSPFGVVISGLWQETPDTLMAGA
jgi:hypothetical protein